MPHDDALALLASGIVCHEGDFALGDSGEPAHDDALALLVSGTRVMVVILLSGIPELCCTMVL